MANTDGLSEKRMGEIALIYVKNKIRKDPIPMNPEKLRREVGIMAKEFGIEYAEAVQFTNIILKDAFKEVLEGISKEKKKMGF